MKKLIILFGAFCISLSAIGQQAIRIGNLEFSVRVQEQDTTALVDVFDEVQTKPTFTPHHRSSRLIGFGFAVPSNNSDSYTILGGNSFNFEVGRMHKYYFARNFALGTTLQYSYSNFRLRNAAIEPSFNSGILGGADITPNYIRRELFRSHNLAFSVFARTYLFPPNIGNRGLYFDIGAQGDWAFSRFYRIRLDHQSLFNDDYTFNLGGQGNVRSKFRDNYAFNPFTASAIARVGLNTRKGKNRALFVRYRFTDAFNSNVLPMDLPPFTIGIQFF